MQILETEIPGLKVMQVQVHRDHRGFFAETWREEWLKALGAKHPFIQDNHACSVQAGVLRGLHFQKPPHAQGKLVWVTKGSVYDVALDVRQGSPTYGLWHGLVLSAENALRFYVPRGFAHGYMTLEPDTEFQYKVDNYYNQASEGGVLWNDPDLGIPWPGLEPVMTDKDKVQPCLHELATPFKFGQD